MRRFIAALKGTLLIGTALLAPIAPLSIAWADSPKFYDVELIIFKNIDPGIMNAEVWPTQAQLPTAPRFLSLTSLLSGANASMGAPYKNYTPLSEADMQLNDSTQRLVASPHYRVLLHIGWRQPAADRKTSLPIWINLPIPAGDPRTPPIHVGATQASAQPTAPVAPTAPDASAPTNPAPAAQPRLEGTVKFFASRYLHVAVHLDYLTSRPTPPADGSSTDQTPSEIGAANLSTGAPTTLPADTSAPAVTAPDASANGNGRTPVVFQLDQERRVHDGVLRYFDHPAFGVLVQVTPYTPPKTQSHAASTPHG